MRSVAISRASPRDDRAGGGHQSDLPRRSPKGQGHRGRGAVSSVRAGRREWRAAHRRIARQCAYVAAGSLRRRRYLHLLPRFLPSSSGGRTLIYSKGSAGGNEMFVWNLVAAEPRLLGDGFSPVYSPTGHIVYEVGPDFWALPFSLETLSPTGEAFPIAQDGAIPSISDDGTLIYTDVVRGRQGLVWLDRQGENLGAIGQPQQDILGLDLSPDGGRVVVHGMEDGNTDVWVHEVDRPLRQRVTFHSGFDGGAIWGPSENEVTFHSTRVLSQRIDFENKSYVISKENNTFSKIIFDIAQFVNVQGQNKFKILRV